MRSRSRSRWRLFFGGGNESSGEAVDYNYDLTSATWSEDATYWGYSAVQVVGSVSPATYKGLSITALNTNYSATKDINFAMGFTQIPGATEVTIVINGVSAVLTWTTDSFSYVGNDAALSEEFAVGGLLATSISDNG